MKRYLSILLLLVLIMAMTNSVLAAESKLNVTIDPRIELLSAIQLLADYQLLTQFDSSYKDSMLKYFSGYREHEAVKLFKEMGAKKFEYSWPPEIMLHLSNPPELKVQTPIEGELLTRAGGKAKLNKFIETARSFAQETKFMQFYVGNRSNYEVIIKKENETIKKGNFVETLEAYYGMKQRSYNIVLAPILHSGGFGPRIKQGNGKFDLYAILGPSQVQNGIPFFRDLEPLSNLVWHEFGHSFVNPLTEKHIASVMKYKSLFDPIADLMAKEAYNEWETCVKEHIVRAVATRLAYRKFGKEAGDSALREEKRKGFFYIEALTERLKEFENNRKNYPTFASFYPRIIDVFKELSEKKLGEEFYSIPFTGPINGIAYDSHQIIVIIPTNEVDKATEGKIVERARNMQCKLKNSYVVEDKEALNMNLSTKNIVVFGTINGNLWLQKYMESFPFRVKQDAIIADKEYGGKDLSLTTALPNPENNKRGLVVFTGQQAADIVDKVPFSYSSDYVVAEGQNILGQGIYKKDNGKWSFN